MNIEESKKILDKFVTEHKLFNIKHSDGLEEAIETLLTAYEKQSKEIEALKLIHESYKEMIEENNYISKDKIKAKIQELKKQWIVDFGVMNTVDVAIHNGIIENKIEALQSLLEKEKE